MSSTSCSTFVFVFVFLFRLYSSLVTLLSFDVININYYGQNYVVSRDEQVLIKASFGEDAMAQSAA
jgi:hypothetical protein